MYVVECPIKTIAIGETVEEFQACLKPEKQQSLKKDGKSILLISSLPLKGSSQGEVEKKLQTLLDDPRFQQVFKPEDFNIYRVSKTRVK